MGGVTGVNVVWIIFLHCMVFTIGIANGDSGCCAQKQDPALSGYDHLWCVCINERICLNKTSIDNNLGT